MERLIDFHAPEVQAVLPLLLEDKSTKRNIIWATDPPEALRGVADDKSEITIPQLQQMGYEAILPRMMKQADTQQERTRKKGEVFSPAWVCNKMNNALDADWFRGLGAHLEPLKKSITKEIIAPMVEQAKQEYGRNLKLSDQKRFESSAKAKMDAAVNKVVDNYRIDQNQLETQRAEQLKTCTTAQQRQEVNCDFDAQQQQSTAALMETLQSAIQQTAQEMQQTIVRTVETNQIFTPKWVVKNMVDLLEQENPGCFDDPDKTFLDPYMKSGLYITEIVKHLYRSEKMRQTFPDDNARLEHIFAKQVYGLAPTEIIYRIAISYILGFAKEHPITKHHIRQADTLEFAKAGTMERELDRIFKD